MKHVFQVDLSDVVDAVTFVTRLQNEIESDVDATISSRSKDRVYDAKSMMSITSVSWSVIEVTINTDDIVELAKFNNICKDYEFAPQKAED